MATWLNPDAPAFVPSFGGGAADNFSSGLAGTPYPGGSWAAHAVPATAASYAGVPSSSSSAGATDDGLALITPDSQKSSDVISTRSALLQAMKFLNRERIIYVDCEGADLSKGSWRNGRQLEDGVEGARPLHGQLCLMQIGTADGQVFVLDIQELGSAAFDFGLRKLLEDDKVTKVMHDFRQDADALWHQFSVSVNSLFDCQLCDVFIRRLNQLGTKYVRGSAKLFQEYGLDLQNIPGYGLLTQEKKLEIHARFSEDRHLWQRRPLPEDMILYAKADILPMPRLHQALRHRLVSLMGDAYLADRLMLAGSAAYAMDFVERSNCCCRLCCRAEENARFDGNRLLTKLWYGSFQQEPWVVQRLWRSPEDDQPLKPPGPSKFYVNENDESVPL